MKKSITPMQCVSVFMIGGMGYLMLELLWRGHSHWTMIICGGICFLGLYITEEKADGLPLLEKSLIGSALITTVELFTGIIVNLILKWNVWDYSSLPYDLLGQICLPYSLLWFFLCIPIFVILGHRKARLKKRLSEEGTAAENNI